LSWRQTLNRVLFWVFVVPLMLLGTVVVPLAMEPRTPGAIAIAAAWVLFWLLLLLVVYDHKRFWPATRLFTAVMFIGFASALVREVFFAGPSPATAAWHFVSFGLPCLWYTLWGRETFRKKEAASDAPPG
jgi:hypothetical protein